MNDKPMPDVIYAGLGVNPSYQVWTDFDSDRTQYTRTQAIVELLEGFYNPMVGDRKPHPIYTMGHKQALDDAIQAIKDMK